MLVPRIDRIVYLHPIEDFKSPTLFLEMGLRQSSDTVPSPMLWIVILSPLLSHWVMAEEEGLEIAAKDAKRGLPLPVNLLSSLQYLLDSPPELALLVEIKAESLSTVFISTIALDRVERSPTWLELDSSGHDESGPVFGPTDVLVTDSSVIRDDRRASSATWASCNNPDICASSFRLSALNL